MTSKKRTCRFLFVGLLTLVALTAFISLAAADSPADVAASGQAAQDCSPPISSVPPTTPGS